ncbi:phosphatase PAP2 family protein [Candidatus Nomurabacteria bacterium]|nr:phosphatase PAP2 family protein [Candidatus Nomurabacteria bacterium]
MMMEWNNQLFMLLHSTVKSSGPFADVVYWVADRLDTWLILFLLLWFLHRAWQHHIARDNLFCLSCFHEVMMVIITGLTSWGLAGILKILLKAPRPFMIDALQAVPLFIPNDPWGFPSGHTALFFALALVTWFHDRVVGTVALVLGGMIALARIMAGVHFPLDILGGMVIAAITIVVIMIFDKRHLRK